MLALALVLFVRARILNRASIERDGLSRFRDNFRGRFPEALVAETYHYLAARHGDVGPHYEVKPSDELARDFSLANLDLEDAVLVIADRGRARLPKVAELDQLKTNGVRSVEDLLRFLEPFFRAEAGNG